jgi:Trk-type K+ transport system membrane component
MVKTLSPNSKYNQHDNDGDGVISDVEMLQAEKMLEIENKDKKEDQLRQMAWVAMTSMIIFTICLFLPILSLDRLVALDNLISMFYIAQAGVVATFFGSSAYMSKN